jgi:adenine deaminase
MLRGKRFRTGVNCFALWPHLSLIGTVDAALAANTVIELEGGMAIATGGKVLAAILLTTESGAAVVREIRDFEATCE